MLIERSLTPADLDLICRHRKEMFRASGRPDRSEQTLNTMTTSFLAWLEPRLVSGSYFGFVIEDDLMPIAGIGLMVIDWPPHPIALAAQVSERVGTDPVNWYHTLFASGRFRA
jgi:hypothetical protein